METALQSWLSDKKCETCGEQATGVMRHAYDISTPSSTYREIRPSKEWHYYCDAHMIESQIFPEDNTNR